MNLLVFLISLTPSRMIFIKTVNLLSLLFCALYLNAQNNSITTGGSATGTGGSTAYSIGQPFYTVATNGTISATAGLQQPLEISVVTGLRSLVETITAKVYPNPASSTVVLEIEKLPGDRFDAILQNAEGKTFAYLQCNNNRNIIRLDGLPAGIYYLNVYRKQQILRVFQIVKSR